MKRIDDDADNNDDDNVGGKGVEMRRKEMLFTFLVEFRVLRVKTDLFLSHCHATVMQL